MTTATKYKWKNGNETEIGFQRNCGISMLELKNITKVYTGKGETVEALKGISLRFRASEFVSVLGPSGCGKTTLLNIMGGLDQYTTGDLFIRGVSTKEYKDRDWDAYRNHSIGFVFQSYNLIPHQSVLQNVELALTLAGISKRERKTRAAAALEKVGLGDQMRKRPQELSGGQMQRVAIARAIVNDPDIILADEPTGALDTATGVQVMNILQEIARDRLVIMVTHNPELAKRYSTRIIRMRDGRILSDSNPPLAAASEDAPQAAQTAEIDAAKPAPAKKNIAPENPATKREAEPVRSGSERLPSMSLLTSFALSLKNLISKKGRTILTGFAGSIGIIGIALIFAVSHGMTGYIHSVQEETLSIYPLSIEAKSVDMTTLIENFIGSAKSAEKHKNDAVYQKQMLYDMMNAMSARNQKENDLRSFKAYIEKERKDSESKIARSLSAVQYAYAAPLQIYTENTDGSIIRSDTEALTRELFQKYMGAAGIGDQNTATENGAGAGNGAATDTPAGTEMSTSAGGATTVSDLSFGNMTGSSASFMRTANSLWRELLPNGEDPASVSSLVKKQNKLVYGRWPQASDEIILFLDEHNELDDLTLYALGLKSRDEIDRLMQAAIRQEPIDFDGKKWTYEEIGDRNYHAILPADAFVYNEETGTYTDLRKTEAGLKYAYDKALALRVVGVAKPVQDAVNKHANGYIGYTRALTNEMLTRAADAAPVKAQLKTPDRDVRSGLLFRDGSGKMERTEKAHAFTAYVERLDEEGKEKAYRKILSIAPDDVVQAQTEETLSSMSREELLAALSGSLEGKLALDRQEIETYINDMEPSAQDRMLRNMIAEGVKARYAAEAEARLAGGSAAQYAAALDQLMQTLTEEEKASYYDTVPEFSDASYEEVLSAFGYAEEDSPATVNLYTSTFEAKDLLKEAIADYNDSVSKDKKIQYTDFVGLIMSSVTTIIRSITYVLIAFVAVSLIVSSIMIGVITLISVQERTKEIGILRAMGASRRNVSGMFNAETLMIGFIAGVLGIAGTYLLEIPINAVLHSLTGINNLSTSLPVPVALALILISMLLTLLAGIIPSRSAAKKDPVVSLRTE